MHNGRLQLEALIKEVHDIIRKERGPADPLATLKADNIIDRAHHVTWQAPLLGVVGVAALALVAVYLGFFFYTEHYTNGVLARLVEVLGS